VSSTASVLLVTISLERFHRRKRQSMWHGRHRTTRSPACFHNRTLRLAGNFTRCPGSRRRESAGRFHVRTRSVLAYSFLRWCLSTVLKLTSISVSAWIIFTMNAHNIVLRCSKRSWVLTLNVVYSHIRSTLFSKLNKIINHLLNFLFVEEDAIGLPWPWSCSEKQ
jgi:hypothetical protein